MPYRSKSRSQARYSSIERLYRWHASKTVT